MLRAFVHRSLLSLSSYPTPATSCFQSVIGNEYLIVSDRRSQAVDIYAVVLPTGSFRRQDWILGEHGTHPRTPRRLRGGCSRERSFSGAIYTSQSPSGMKIFINTVPAYLRNGCCSTTDYFPLPIPFPCASCSLRSPMTTLRAIIQCCYVLS